MWSMCSHRWAQAGAAEAFSEASPSVLPQKRSRYERGCPNVPFGTDAGFKSLSVCGKVGVIYFAAVPLPSIDSIALQYSGAEL